MAGEIKKTTREILAENRARQSPLQSHFILLAHNIRSLYNIGSIFRSADAFGIHAFWISGYSPFPPRIEISKTALGAELSVNWKYISDPYSSVLSLKKNDYTIYGLEQTSVGESLIQHRISAQKICLILGNEVTGIDTLLIPLVDHFVEIPQYGDKHSLNVSVAAGIALYDFLGKMI